MNHLRAGDGAPAFVTVSPADGAEQIYPRRDEFGGLRWKSNLVSSGEVKG